MEKALEYAKCYAGWNEHGEANRWGRAIRLYSSEEDSTIGWRCPDCNRTWGEKMSKLILVCIALFLSGNSLGGSLSIPTNTVSIQEGKRLYIVHCIECHNPNPSKNGILGPELISTPQEAFYTKVVKGSYPKGYVPKRKTKYMPIFNELDNKVYKIYDYISDFARKNKK